MSPRSPEELIALLKRLPNSVSREESTSDVSVRFYQTLRWDLDQIRDVITPRIMQYPTDQALIDRLVEFDDASRNLKHAIIVHKEVLTHSGEVANRWTDERTRASDRPLLGRFLGRRGPLGISTTGRVANQSHIRVELGTAPLVGERKLQVSID